MDEYKLVVVARKDLKLTAGKLAAQVGHAAVDCALKAQRHQPDAFKRWYDAGQRKVVVKGEGERELFELKATAERAGFTTALIADAGRTHLEPGTVTVLGIGPAPEVALDKITGHLALY